jgi:hypothetical protein
LAFMAGPQGCGSSRPEIRRRQLLDGLMGNTPLRKTPRLPVHRAYFTDPRTAEGPHN